MIKENKKYHKLRNITIKKRMLLFFTIIMILIIVTAITLIYKIMTNTIDLINRNNNSIIEYINQDMLYVEDTMNSVTKFPIIINNMKENYIYKYLEVLEKDGEKKSVFDYSYYQNEFERQGWGQLYSNPVIEGLLIEDPLGITTRIDRKRSAGYENEIDYGELKQELENKKGRGFIIPRNLLPNEHFFKDDSMIYYGRAIVRYNHRKVVGFIIAMADGSKKADYFNEHKMFDEQELYILNEDNEILFSIDDNDNNLDLFNDSYDSFISKGKDKGYIYNKKSKEYLLYNFKITDGLKTVVFTPGVIILKHVLSNGINILLLVLIMVVILFLVLRKILLSIVEPISDLEEGSLKFAEGNFSPIDVLGKDEMTNLTISYNNMAKEIEKLIEEVYKKDVLKTNIELQMLRSQINPHFFYNALETIRLKANEVGEKEIEEITLLMAKLLRDSLAAVPTQMITIKEEISMLNIYIKLQKIYYKDTIDFRVIISENIKDKKVIKMILQPLVENSIYHGYYAADKKFHITVLIFEEGENIVFNVVDDGKGIKEDRLKDINDNLKIETTEKKNIGLRNLERRIKLIYGDEYGLEIDSMYGFGTSVRIIVPVE